MRLTLIPASDRSPNPPSAEATRLAHEARKPIARIRPSPAPIAWVRPAPITNVNFGNTYPFFLSAILKVESLYEFFHHSAADPTRAEMAAKISHILVWGFCDNPPRESIPIAQPLTTPTAKNAKAIIHLSFPQHQQRKRHRAPNLRPRPELSAATPSLNALSGNVGCSKQVTRYRSGRCASANAAISL
jgi:hypothetical protein